MTFFFTDKQQELDLPSLRIEDAVASTGSADARAAKKKDRLQKGPSSMSHIIGVKKPLTHTNSFTGERVPVHGVETPHEEQLGKVYFSLRFKIFIVLNRVSVPIPRNSYILSDIVPKFRKI